MLRQLSKTNWPGLENGEPVYATGHVSGAKSQYLRRVYASEHSESPLRPRREVRFWEVVNTLGGRSGLQSLLDEVGSTQVLVQSVEEDYKRKTRDTGKMYRTKVTMTRLQREEIGW
jgi:hypothetical protein